MKESDTAPAAGESQEEPSKPESRGRRVARIIATAIALIFFALLVGGAALRKFGG